MMVYCSILLGFILGALIMWLSPAILLAEEPWDARGASFVLYLAALFFAGFIGAKLSKKYFYMVAVGVYLGQVVFLMAFIGGGPLFLVGMVYIAIYSLSALFGAYLSYRL